MQKQTVPAYIRGLDGKTPKGLRVLGTLDAAENVRITKGGELGIELSKRYGTKSLSATTDTGAALSSVRKIKGTASELLLLTTDRLYSRSVGASKWLDKGSCPALTETTTADVFNTAAQTCADMAYANGYRVLAWEDSRGGVRYSVIDQATGQAIVNDGVVDASATLPKVIVSGTAFLIFYVSGGSLKATKVLQASPQTLASPVTVATVGGASQWYDVVQLATDRVAFAVRTGASTYQVGFINSFLSVSSAPAPVSFSGTIDLGAWVNASSFAGYVYLLTYTSGGAMSVVQFDVTGLTQVATTTLDASPGTVRNMTAWMSGTTITTLYEVSAAATYNTITKKAVLSGSVTLSTLKRSLGLASRIFPFGSSTYVALAYDSTTQPTGFVIDLATGMRVVRFHPGVHGGLTTKTGCLPSVWSVDTNTVVFAQLKKDQLETNGTATVFQPTGVNCVTLSSNDHALGAPVEFAGGVVVPSACPSFYDGATAIAASFDLFPETPATAQTTGGSLTTTATYGYLFEWQWRDRSGNIHRSTQSFPVNVTLTGSNTKVTFTVPTDRVTNKSNVILTVWRTAGNASTYYRESSLTSPLFNDSTVDTITYNSTLSDANLLNGEPLFTTLDPTPPPACRVACVHKNRVWIGGTEDGRIYPSLELANNGYSVMFADALARDIDTTLGPVTALASSDEYLVIFHANAIEVLSGDGPDANGQGATWSVPIRLAGTVGTSDPDSIVKTKDGLAFKSPKGWYLLTRSLDVVPLLGADDYAGLTVSGSVLSDNADTVLWTTATGTTVLYDLTFGRFYTYANQQAVAATKWQGVYVWVDSSGVCHQEVPGTYGDDGAPVTSRLVFSFASFAGINGWQRVSQLAFLGEVVGDHVFRASIAYDYLTGAILEDFTFTVSRSTYGTGTYGSETPYGGTVSEFPIQTPKLKVQKCSSVSVTVSDAYPSGNATGGFKLSGLSFLVGLKPGINRLSLTRTMQSDG